MHSFQITYRIQSLFPTTVFYQKITPGTFLQENRKKKRYIFIYLQIFSQKLTHICLDSLAAFHAMNV